AEVRRRKVLTKLLRLRLIRELTLCQRKIGSLVRRLVRELSLCHGQIRRLPRRLVREVARSQRLSVKLASRLRADSEHPFGLRSPARNRLVSRLSVRRLLAAVEIVHRVAVRLRALDDALVGKTCAQCVLAALKLRVQV